MWRRGDRGTRASALLAGSGRVGRELAIRLDVGRAAGLRYALHRIRRDGELAAARKASRNAVYASIWRDAATELGAVVAELSEAVLEISRDGAKTRVWHQTVMLDDGVTLSLAMEKALVYRLLSANAIAVPEHLEIASTKFEEAVRFLRAGHSPCVVKPAGATGAGEGVSTGVRTRAQMARAVLRAGRNSARIVIERQAAGDVYRVLLLDGELLDVVRRTPPTVTGDGRSTIAELIRAENQRRLEAAGYASLRFLLIDLDSILTLQAAGLRPSSVLERGITVPVKTVTSQNAPEDNVSVRDAMCDEVRTEAATAASVVGLRLAGVDILTTDPTEPLATTGGVIIEVNGRPGLHHHYEVANRANAARVAVPILQTLLT